MDQQQQLVIKSTTCFPQYQREKSRFENSGNSGIGSKTIIPINLRF
jgi:hypothetical protein